MRPVGWRGESYRHYLAAKGVRTYWKKRGIFTVPEFALYSHNLSMRKLRGAKTNDSGELVHDEKREAAADAGVVLRRETRYEPLKELGVAKIEKIGPKKPVAAERPSVTIVVEDNSPSAADIAYETERLRRQERGVDYDPEGYYYNDDYYDEYEYE
jgi:hypothetical protein